MSWQGVGSLKHIEGVMNSEKYQQILEEQYLATLKDKGLEVKETILQQDLDPKHSLHSTKAWLKNHEIQVLP